MFCFLEIYILIYFYQPLCQAVLFPADVGTLSAGNTDIWQEILINLYILMTICNKLYSFPSTVSLTVGLMCFIHFKMSTNVQVVPQTHILSHRKFSTLSRDRRNQQIKERPGWKYIRKLYLNWANKHAFALLTKY